MAKDMQKHVTVAFGKRIFYLPLIPADIHYKDSTICIDMADMDGYVLVDGIRCYYVMTYHADTDTIETWLKDYTIDGEVYTQEYYFQFSLSDKEFPFSQRDQRLVVPKRDNSELTSMFLEKYHDVFPEDLLNEIVKYVTFFDSPQFFEEKVLKKFVLGMREAIREQEENPDSITTFSVKEILSIEGVYRQLKGLARENISDPEQDQLKRLAEISYNFIMGLA